MEGRALLFYPFSLSASFMIYDFFYKDSEAFGDGLLFLFGK